MIVLKLRKTSAIISPKIIYQPWLHLVHASLYRSVSGTDSQRSTVLGTCEEKISIQDAEGVESDRK